MGYIYCIRNKITGKCYIGETSKEDVAERWKQHTNLISRGKGCPALRDAVQKHGLENFDFKVLIICFDEDRFDYERFYIAKYNCQVPNGYNILPGGIGGAGFKGKKHTAESIAKSTEGVRRFREANPDWFERCREKWEQGMAKVDIGAAVKNSPIWQKAKAEGRVGGSSSEDTKKKVSDTLKRYYKDNAEKHKTNIQKKLGKPVNQYDETGILIHSFPCIAEASRQTGIPTSSIYRVLRNLTKQTKGYIWKFAN